MYCSSAQDFRVKLEIIESWKPRYIINQTNLNWTLRSKQRHAIGVERKFTCNKMHEIEERGVRKWWCKTNFLMPASNINNKYICQKFDLE